MGSRNPYQITSGKSNMNRIPLKPIEHPKRIAVSTCSVVSMKDVGSDFHVPDYYRTNNDQESFVTVVAMPGDTLRVEYERLTSSSPTIFQPQRHCHRCLLGASDKERNMIRHPRQKPSWFYRSGNNYLSDVKLPGLEAEDVGGDGDKQIDQLQKVQEWLRRSYRHPVISRKAPERKYVKPTILPKINEQKPKKEKESMNLNKVNMVDYAENESFQYLKRLVPSILPNDIDIEKYLERQARYYHGRTRDFTRYMSPEGKNKLRPGVGPIQRPHTPGKTSLLKKNHNALMSRYRAEAVQARKDQTMGMIVGHRSMPSPDYALPGRSDPL